MGMQRAACSGAATALSGKAMRCCCLPGGDFFVSGRLHRPTRSVSWRGHASVDSKVHAAAAQAHASGVFQSCRLRSCCAERLRQPLQRTVQGECIVSFAAWQVSAGPCCQQQAPIGCSWICMAAGWRVGSCTDMRHSLMSEETASHQKSCMESGPTGTWAKPCCFGRALQPSMGWSRPAELVWLPLHGQACG